MIIGRINQTEAQRNRTNIEDIKKETDAHKQRI